MKIFAMVITLLSCNAFGFCPSKKAESKIKELLEKSAKKDDKKVSNVYYIQFFNDSESGYIYNLTYDVKDKKGIETKFFASIEIDAENPECIITHTRADSMRDLYEF